MEKINALRKAGKGTHKKTPACPHRYFADSPLLREKKPQGGWQHSRLQKKKYIPRKAVICKGLMVV
jgi:hypothetical protein